MNWKNEDIKSEKTFPKSIKKIERTTNSKKLKS